MNRKISSMILGAFFLIIFGCNKQQTMEKLQGDWFGYAYNFDAMDYYFNFSQDTILLTNPFMKTRQIHKSKFAVSLFGKINLETAIPIEFYYLDERFQLAPTKSFKIISISQDTLNLFEENTNTKITLFRLEKMFSKPQKIQLSEDYSRNALMDFDFQIDATSRAFISYSKYGKLQQTKVISIPPKLLNHLFNEQIIHVRNFESERYFPGAIDGSKSALCLFFTDTTFAYRAELHGEPAFLTPIFYQLDVILKNINDGIWHSEVIDTAFYFDSQLSFCYGLADSIRYMAKFDSTNYHLPKLFGQNNGIREYIKNSLTPEIVIKTFAENEPKSFSIDLSISSTGEASIRDFNENDYHQYPQSFKSELERVIGSMPRLLPAVYGGNAVAVEEFVFLPVSDFFD